MLSVSPLATFVCQAIKRGWQMAKVMNFCSIGDRILRQGWLVGFNVFHIKKSWLKRNRFQTSFHSSPVCLCIWASEKRRKKNPAQNDCDRLLKEQLINTCNLKISLFDTEIFYFQNSLQSLDSVPEQKLSFSFCCDPLSDEGICRKWATFHHVYHEKQRQNISVVLFIDIALIFITAFIIHLKPF